MLLKEKVIKKLCSGKQTSFPLSSNGRNHSVNRCLLVHNKYHYLRLGPFKFEIKNIHPFRTIIHDFLAPNEIYHITRSILPKLTHAESKPLLIDASHKALQDPSYINNWHRASSIYFDEIDGDFDDRKNFSIHDTFLRKDMSHDVIRDNRNHIMARLSKRIEWSTHLIITDEPDTQGKFKASLYGLGGMTENHSDSYDVENGKKLSASYEKYFKKAGDIIATLIIWISDVATGGGTYFSSSKAEDIMLPKEGSALLWINLNSSGYKNEQQSHGGCPVADGKKFIITKWYYDYFQYRKFPCETKPDNFLSMLNKWHFLPYNVSSPEF